MGRLLKATQMFRFCKMHQEIINNPAIFVDGLFSKLLMFCLSRLMDVETFGRDGVTNFHNAHQWAEENPRGALHDRQQQEFGINMWAGIGGDGVVGPHVLPQRITCKF